jgi:predicted ATPase/serine/threonine protein kinase
MERWATVKRLHQAALEREGNRRAAFLDEACAGDAVLRDEVQSLLAYDQDAESFMESPALEVTARGLSEAPTITLVGRTISHYEVVSLLGAGGMGEVYLARDPRLERSVALKILPPDLALDADRMQRFVREAKAASALNHPNVATIYDVGESDALSFIAMEYVEGQTLAAKIAGGPLTVAEIVDVVVQVADALDAAHAKGITHRDIKPANLMRTPRGQAKVLDFGVAKTTWREGSTQTGELPPGSQTAVGIVVGSAPYISPEQILGLDVDHRSDLFSLGVTMYEMATAHRPFSGGSPSETMDRILHAQPEPIGQLTGHIPAELERITFKCLEKDIEHRYQSACDLLVDLRNLKRQTNADIARSTISEVRRDNLPAQLTSFVGRGSEISEIQRLLAGTRLLTLTGAGGCGKTRLALQVAAELLDQFRDGVWLVDLAPLSEPDLITQTMAAVLGVREGPGRSLADALTDYFRPRHVLLVLDNCEHLIAACAQLVEPLLRAAPNLHVLATSREGLGIPGETVWRVPSLALPDSSQPVSAAALQQFEAIRLFVDRARAVGPAFAVTETNAAIVAETCRRLDGIPLAIELAAARLNVLSVEQIGARLKDRFRLLTGGSRTAVARQRTLEATVDWSYELLSEPERQLLCRLSVFPGGWTLEAAEHVCSDDGIDKDNTLDLLSHLVDKSLVIVEHPATGERRYRFLETVRQYGREHLLRSGDAERWHERHFAFFFESFRHAEPRLRGPEQISWLNRLQLEHDNLRSALEWSMAAPERGTQALELAAALFWFWTKRGYFSEGQQWLERALAGAIDPSPALRARALIALSHMTYFRGDYARTQILLDESLTLAREADDVDSAAFSLGVQGLVAMERGDFEKAAVLAAECLAAATASRDVWFQCWPLGIRAFVALHDGNYQQASELFEQELAFVRQTGDTWLVGIVLFDVAGVSALQQHDAEAKALVTEGILLYQELRDDRGTAWCLEALAAIEAAQGRLPRAVRLWGAAEALLEGLGSPPLPGLLAGWMHDHLKSARESLDEPTFQDAWSEGHAMSLQRAIQYALVEQS